ncbi:phosphatase PAP2 family protein [Aciduricibacillus chroicocephali]|uniref:Phosphatase PAP2 family protein n=1 Tax=Aciduricibacillus chroicocephali TaxID=3054939 RepID=A0ABY9KXW2_9BACI|nr:phosphatase PAP2 family protein [Bacillaceae bacterium 44XB]
MKRKRIFHWTLLIIIAIVVSIWIHDVMIGELPLVDKLTRAFVTAFGNTSYYRFFTWSTHFGSKSFLIPFVIVMAIVLIYMYRRVLPGVMFAFGTLFGWIFNELIKSLVQRQRPSLNPGLDAIGTSFPSGHAMISFICYGLLLYFLIVKIKSRILQTVLQILIPIIILVIGLGRYLINVHYLTDVMAGYFFGYLFLIVWIKLYKKLSVNKR